MQINVTFVVGFNVYFQVSQQKNKRLFSRKHEDFPAQTQRWENSIENVTFPITLLLSFVKPTLQEQAAPRNHVPCN